MLNWEGNWNHKICINDWHNNGTIFFVEEPNGWLPIKKKLLAIRKPKLFYDFEGCNNVNRSASFHVCDSQK
tara:strand:+ start:868 stop:1080 length:213 start_codon:yes stop_codon:yes gene_type:complete